MKTHSPMTRIVPRGYRVRYRFFFLVLVAGRYRFCESVPIVQRFQGDDPDDSTSIWDCHWHDVGFLDEAAEAWASAAEAWDGESAS